MVSVRWKISSQQLDCRTLVAWKQMPTHIQLSRILSVCDLFRIFFSQRYSPKLADRGEKYQKYIIIPPPFIWNSWVSLNYGIDVFSTCRDPLCCNSSQHVNYRTLVRGTQGSQEEWEQGYTQSWISDIFPLNKWIHTYISILKKVVLLCCWVPPTILSWIVVKKIKA